MNTLTFTEFAPAHPAKTPGKTVPPKVKTADGTEYVLAKNVDQAVLSANLGKPFEVTVTTKVNGDFTNHTLESALLVAGATSPAAATAAVPPRNGGNGGATNGYVSDEARQRLIVRQSCLKAAVDLVNGGHAPYKDIRTLAEKLVDWVYGSPSVVAATGPADGEYPWN